MTHYSSANKIYNIKSDSKDPYLEINNKNVKTVLLPTNNEDSNSLPGLLAHYNSDSEQDEDTEKHVDKLDAKVDDFLQEINNLAPRRVEQKSDARPKKNAQTLTWQECFDDTSGYPYYWNIETNEVTWEMPEEYRKWLAQNAVEPKVEKKAKEDNQCQIKVNKIINEQLEKAKEAKERPSSPKKKKRNKKKSKRAPVDSDDEKIVLITSFSEDSSSDTDSEKNEANNKKETCPEVPVIMGPHLEDISKKQETAVSIPSDSTKKEIIVENIKDENIDETVILSRLRTQAKVLQELGGELPKSVDRSIILDKVEAPEQTRAPGLSLVAGYGDDTDEEEPPNKPVFPVVMQNTDVLPEQPQSTLFPITKPIDVKQFEPIVQKQPSATAKQAEEDSVLDNKLFKRKKRLGISFGMPQLKNDKKFKLDDAMLGENGNEERKGFGFQKSEADTHCAEDKTDKVAFVKGGIAFVKADVLNPAEPATTKAESEGQENETKSGDFEEMKDVVSEKVRFLSEGKDPVSTVQVMLIQLQTLETAFKAGGLSETYFYSWLRETSIDLAKLEDDAAPNGWHCQWDRLNKRYFYRNQQTGDTQWEYPVPDIVGGGEAMDICTTPPPSDEPGMLVCELAAASPPAAREASATPPPLPPTPTPSAAAASTEHGPLQEPVAVNTDELETHASAASESSVVVATEIQPLPPGVDSPDLTYYTCQAKETSNGALNQTNDALVSELDSFYSDIAMLEATTTSTTEPAKTEPVNAPSPTASTDSATMDQVVFKKKKRSKPKIGQRIDMKKKAVSTLVEKWKKVQNDYL